MYDNWQLVKEKKVKSFIFFLEKRFFIIKNRTIFKLFFIFIYKIRYSFTYFQGIIEMYVM